MLRALDKEPLVAERVMSFDLMMALVAAGFVLALVGVSQIAASRESNIVARPLAGGSLVLTTYLLRRAGDSSEALGRFVERVGRLEADTGK